MCQQTFTPQTWILQGRGRNVTDKNENLNFHLWPVPWFESFWCSIRESNEVIFDAQREKGPMRNVPLTLTIHNIYNRYQINCTFSRKYFTADHVLSPCFRNFTLCFTQTYFPFNLRRLVPLKRVIDHTPYLCTYINNSICIYIRQSASHWHKLIVY